MVAEMQQMREDFAVGQEEAASKLARSSRRDPYSFRRKGNENQYRFCEDVEERLETTSAAIARAERGAGREALARAKAKEGMELLTHRKKLIKLADRSEVGWAVVEEYVDDDLADDSDDERRMEKAERAAERKVAAKRRKEREAGAKRARLSEPEPLAPEGKRPLRPGNQRVWFLFREARRALAINAGSLATGGVTAPSVVQPQQRILY